MEFKKIQLTKQNTLTVVYKNGDSDTITMAGANIVHRDLKEAFRNLVPHLVLITEQKESVGNTLESLRSNDLLDDDGIFRKFHVTDLTLGEKEVVVSLSGTRILDRGDVVSVDSPKVNLEEDEHYQYISDLSLDVQNLIYEVKLYVTEKKWALKEGTLNFGDTDEPFPEVKPGDVPEAEIPKNEKVIKTRPSRSRSGKKKVHVA